jgi:hypothetical protein
MQRCTPSVDSPNTDFEELRFIIAFLTHVDTLQDPLRGEGHQLVDVVQMLSNAPSKALRPTVTGLLRHISGEVQDWTAQRTALANEKLQAVGAPTLSEARKNFSAMRRPL